MRLSDRRIGNGKIAALVFIAAILLLPLSGATADAAVNFELTYKNGLTTLEADRTPLMDVLMALTEASGIEILVSKEIVPGEVSLVLVDEPTELVLKRLLRGYSYAVVYAKRRDAWQVASVKIYPEGQQGGEVMALAPRSAPGDAPATALRTVLYPSGEEFVTYGKIDTKGLVIPSRTVPANSGKPPADFNAPWFKLQKQLEYDENRRYAELVMLQQKIQHAENPAARDALAMSYADEVAQFFTIKKANLNKIEALKRIYESNQGGGKN